MEIRMFHVLEKECYMRFEGLTALTMKITVFEMVCHAVWCICTNSSEKPAVHFQGCSVSYVWIRCYRYGERVDWGKAMPEPVGRGRVENAVKQRETLRRDFSSASLKNGSSHIQILIFCILLPLLGWPDLCPDLLCSYVCIVISVYALFTFSDDRRSSFCEVSIDVFHTVWCHVSEDSLSWLL